ncbi:hypothetical protein JXA88_03995 [Candidatus Fermentibacteria bacterium]|nr:hypothetical protein [Candidatus Fermentibacteria bacterium]
MRMAALPILLALLPALASAEIPTVISYQCKVTDSSGNPVPDGNYNVWFRIYDAPSGGTMLWSSGTRTVALAGGIFSILLGESPQPAITLDFSTDYWLLVTFNDVEQSPRQRMASVGYAYMASGLVPGTQVSGEITSYPYAAIQAVNVATTGTAYGLAGTSYSAAGHGVYGLAFANTGMVSGVYGASASNQGRGVWGTTTATMGITCGVRGESYSTAGRGVHGLAGSGTGYTFGVYGESASPDGTGVLGYASAATGYTCGVSGESASTDGKGVQGRSLATAGSSYGVRAESYSTGGRGVYASAWAATGVTSGVWGESYSADGRGVLGFASSPTGSTYGVYGWSNSVAGRGVYGWAAAGSGSTYGVFGTADSPNGTGVYGTGQFCGLYGESSGGDGLRSFSSAENKSGVFGVNTLTAGATYGVYGRAYSPAGYAVYYSGNLGGTGTKSCVVKTSKGPTLLYCQESPENWFEDVGRARLTAGSAFVELDPVYLETVTIDDAHPMEVFVQLRDDCRGVFVKAGSSGFDVKELQGGASNAEFSYRVMAKRKGFETRRLDVCEAARTDSYLYPALREVRR